MADALPPPPPRNLILGPILLGSCFAWCLFGILIVQIYFYYRWYPKDSIALKLLVAGLLILELADTAVSTHALWYFTITIWGDSGSLFASPWSFCLAVMLTGIIAAVAQFFFAVRLWILSRSIVIIVVVVLLALVQLACSLLGGAQVLSTHVQNSSKLSTFQAFSIWLACSAACDIAIAAGMVFFLSKSKKGAIKATEYLITRLTNFAIRTGTFTAICAVITLALFLGLKTTDMTDLPFFMLAKLYSNAVLANLNARASLQAGNNSVEINATDLSDNVQFAVNGSGPTAASGTLTLDSVGQKEKEADESKTQLA